MFSCWNHVITSRGRWWVIRFAGTAFRSGAATAVRSLAPLGADSRSDNIVVYGAGDCGYYGQQRSPDHP